MVIHVKPSQFTVGLSAPGGSRSATPVNLFPRGASVVSSVGRRFKLNIWLSCKTEHHSINLNKSDLFCLFDHLKAWLSSSETAFIPTFKDFLKKCVIFIKHTCFWWCLTFCFSFCFLFHNAGEDSNVCGCKFQSSVREKLKGFSGNWKQFWADPSALLHFCGTFFYSNQPQGTMLRQHSHKNIIVVCLKSIL